MPNTQIIEHPYYPIIFVRGYAGDQNAIEEASADPYMGLNIGSTRQRQLWTGDVVKYFFESPLVRLMKDHQYADVYSGGAMMAPGENIPAKSVIIHRYYDVVSKDWADGSNGDIEQFAEGLGELILQVRERVCGDDAAQIAAFKVYLVAHSMGGLICRTLLQNAKLNATAAAQTRMGQARSLVDKVFTYATPHNGIDLRLFGNVPGFLSANHMNNFNRDRMREYLAVPKTDDGNVDTLNGMFDPNRFFCLIGTNSSDYEVASGMSKRIVGPMSDGLVRINNATVSGMWLGKKQGSPRAFVHRSHSGPYGIVNSEEGYQNLKRFFFGDVRVDGELEVNEVMLPAALDKAWRLDSDGNQIPPADRKALHASYHFEAILRVRGAAWDMHRRVMTEGSAAFATYDDLTNADPSKRRSPHLFSAFLSLGARVNPKRSSLGFSLDLGVLVPQYELDGFLMFDDHYEGGYLFRDKLNFEVTPPKDDSGDPWQLRCGVDSKTPNRATMKIEPTALPDGGYVFRIPVEQNTKPGIMATLKLTARSWNELED